MKDYGSFDLVIYPYKIYVVIGNEDANKYFLEIDGNVGDGYIETGNEFDLKSIAQTDICINKKNYDIGVMIQIGDKYSSIGYDVISHESYHAAHFIFNMIGENGDRDTEAMAYLCGYISKCVCKYLKGKIEIK